MQFKIGDRIEFQSAEQVHYRGIVTGYNKDHVFMEEVETLFTPPDVWRPVNDGREMTFAWNDMWGVTVVEPAKAKAITGEGINKVRSVFLGSGYDVSAISALVVDVPVTVMNATMTLKQIVVLDAEDRFMLLITPDQAEHYIAPDGYVDTEAIYNDFILEPQVEEVVITK